MRQLRFGKAVEMCNNGVEFVDQVFFVVFAKRATFDAYGSSPFAKTLVRACESSGECDRPLP